jgi:hypothetical protein
MLDFPSSPSNAQVYNSPNGTSWIWDGAKWTSAAFTGVTIDTHYRNRIINGDMSVDQRNGGSVVPAPSGVTYIIDRWKLASSYATSHGSNIGQSTGPVTAGFTNALIWISTATAYTPAAGDNLYWLHYVEGCNFNDANWGTANALPIVLEFWAAVNVAGTYAGSFRNAATNRSYVFTFALVANTWTKVRINIPGDTTGTWAVANNAAALILSFNLGSGSTSAAAAGAWTAGNFYTAPGATNIVTTANGNITFTGVALMVGAAAANAEPEFRKYSDNLIDCQRYFFKPTIATSAGGYGGGAANVNVYPTRNFPVVMRAAPTTSGAAFGGFNYNAPSSALATTGVQWAATNTAIGSFTLVVSGDTYDADF